MFGVDMVKEVPLTPNQARQKGVPADVVKKYADRKTGGFTLEPETENDIRRALT
jgi:hypothetical protein